MDELEHIIFYSEYCIYGIYIINKQMVEAEQTNLSGFSRVICWLNGKMCISARN